MPKIDLKQPRFLSQTMATTASSGSAEPSAGTGAFILHIIWESPSAADAADLRAEHRGPDRVL